MIIDLALELFVLMLKAAAMIGFVILVRKTKSDDSDTYKVSLLEEYKSRKQAPFIYKPYTDNTGINMAMSQMEYHAANRH